MTPKIKRLAQEVKKAEVEFTRAGIHWAQAQAIALRAKEERDAAEEAERQAKINWAVAVATDLAVVTE